MSSSTRPRGAATIALAEDPPRASPSPTLSPTELAARWKCSTGFLANERSRGAGIPFHKMFSGGRILYLLSDVLAAESAARVMPTGCAA